MMEHIMKNHKPEILVVEDSLESLNYLTELLSKQGYKVRPASCGKLALQSLEAKLPDLIILDIKLPDYDGYEICRSLKANKTCNMLPVIFISALNETSEKIEAFNAGGVDYITKPFYPEEVLARVKTHLHIRDLTEKLEHKVEIRTTELNEINEQLQQKIIEQRAAEEKLKESEELHRITIENISDPVFITDDHGNYTYICPNAYHTLGFTSEEIRKMKNIERLIGSDLFVLEELKKQKEIHNIEQVITDKAGNKHDFLITVKYVSIKGGTILYVCHDITERKQSEIILRENEKKYRTLVSNIPGIVYRCRADKCWTMEFISDMVENITGYPADDFIANKVRSYSSIIHEDDRAMVMQNVEARLDKQQEYSIDYRITSSDGSIHNVYEKGKGIFDTNNQLLYLDGAIFDVTDIRLLEDQLKQAQKMEAVGRLTSGIAHDLNNMLCGVLGYSDILSYELESTDSRQRYIKGINKSVNSGAALINKLLGFSRKGKGIYNNIDMNQLIEDITNLLKAGITQKIHLNLELRAQQTFIKADQTMIQNAILNLGINARDALQNKGEITIMTENEYLDEDFCKKSRFNIKPGNYIMISVGDNGIGMDMETQKKIFDPFFTTKEIGKGTGLGLSVVYTTLKEHNGAILVKSQKGKGTEFKLYLPVNETVTEELEEKNHIPRHCTGCILFIDDEEAIRYACNKYLKKIGYNMILASNGNEAIEKYKEEKENIDLIVVDMIMPEMDGLECMQNIKAINPQAKIILTSGYAESPDVTELLEKGLNGFLQKPFKSEKLAQTVNKVLTQ